VTLILKHDDGTKSRELIADVKLPGVPQVGDRVRAGRIGNFFTVQRVFWSDHSTPSVHLAHATEADEDFATLTRNGWRVAFETQAARRASAPDQDPQAASNVNGASRRRRPG
jgi:hypothetical protein